MGYLRSLKTKISKFISLPSNDKIFIFSSLYNLIISLISLKLFKYKKSLDHYSSRYKIDNSKQNIDLNYINKLSELNLIASTILPLKVTCLQRSFTLWLMLRKKGFYSDIKIGVNKKDSFSAHAWVEINNIVINDKSDIRNDFLVLELKDENISITDNL